MGNSDCAGVVMEADGQTGRRSILKNRTGNRIWVIRGLKALSLLAAVLAVLSIAWKTLYIHRNYDEDRIIGFYREPEDSLDVVLIGASDIGATAVLITGTAISPSSDQQLVVLPLSCSFGLLLTLYAGLLVVFSLTDFLLDARLCAASLETTQSAVQSLILFNNNV